MPHLPAVLIVSTCLAGAVVAGEPAYTLIELDTPAGMHSQAFGISPNGMVAGSVNNDAVLWIDQVLTPLGDPLPGFGYEARAVNDAGQVAVVAEANPQAYSSWRYDNGVWTELGDLPGLNDTIVDDIDGAGRIVGRSFILGPSAPDRAFRWDGGAFEELGTLGEGALAFGTNETGGIVGRTQAAVSETEVLNRGFRWINGTMSALPVLVGDIGSQAFDLNDAGDAVGSSWALTTQFLSTDQATLWPADGGHVIDLGAVPAEPFSCSAAPFWSKSIARAINNDGVVVGEAMCTGSGAPKAAFVHIDGVMYNLNDLIPAGTTLDLRSARDINDDGAIVGYGVTPGGMLRAFLLLPIEPACPADLDDSNAVDLGDLLTVLAAWGPCDACHADLDDDGTVGLTDLLTLLSMWGPCGI